MIEGTYRRETRATGAAYSGDTEDAEDSSSGMIHDQLVIIQDEAQPSQFGIGTRETGSFGSNASNPQAEDSYAAFKARTSEGFYMTSTVKFNEEGRRVHAEERQLCRSAQWWAMNVGLTTLPDSAQSRCHCREATARDRHAHDNGGLLDIVAGSDNRPAIKQEIWSDLAVRMKRTHMLFWFVAKLIYVGILPEVDMRVARLFAVNLLRGKHKGVRNGNDVRRMQRLFMLIRTLVVLSAIDALFDDPMSPIAHRPWQPAYFLLLRKYLVAKTEHVSMAFGLMHDQYENPVIDKVEKALIDLIRVNSTEHRRADVPTVSYQTQGPTQPGRMTRPLRARSAGQSS